MTRCERLYSVRGTPGRVDAGALAEDLHVRDAVDQAQANLDKLLAALDAVRELPLWPMLLQGVVVLPREGREMVDYRFQPERFAELDLPTLVLCGEQSPTYRHEATRALDGALPDSELRILAGQDHVAAQTAPDLLVAEILGFLGD